MDASANALAATIRAKRNAIDNDLELLRVRLRQADPRRRVNGMFAQTALSMAIGAAMAAWWWAKRRSRVDSLDELLVHGLTTLYREERLLVPALRRMSARATNADLKQAFDQHAHETEGHVERLVRVFRAIGAQPLRKKVPGAIAALIAEGERVMKRKADADVRDAWLIATAQRIEHIEIAAYGTVRTFAETVGYTHAAQLLQQTLDEEKAADERLTQLAERFVNPQAIREVRPA